MRGASVLINGNEPKGRFIEGIVSGTPAPGMFMEVTSAEPVDGRRTYRFAQTGSAGDRRPTIILLDDTLQGVPADSAGANLYTAGRRCQLYVPSPGDELNILFKNISGTSDSFAIGAQVMNDVGTGKAIVQAAAANNAPFTVQETVAALAADVMVHCMFN